MSKLSFAAVLLCASPLVAQQTGVSHPPQDDASIASAPASPAAREVPVVAAPVLVVPTGSPAATTQQTITPTEDNSVTLHRHEQARVDPDADIVTEQSIYRAGEVASGTLLRARLRNAVGTTTTAVGSPFTAELTNPLLHEGRVILPSGTLVEGNVTEVHGGRRAIIHLQPHTVVLPDGSRLPLHAALIDTDQFQSTKIDAEGNVVGKSHTGQNVATVGLAAGSGAAAGGLLAGVPGALIGAGIGAGVSTVVWLKQDHQTQLPADSLLVLALTAPMSIATAPREPEFSVAPTASAPPRVSAAAEKDIEPQAFVPLN